MELSIFMRVGGVFQLFWESGGISRIQTVVRLLTLMICLETITAPVGVSFSLLMWSASWGSGSSRSWLLCHLGPIWINNVTCSDKDRPRDYHTKWSKSVRERQWFHLRYHSYVESSFFKRYNWTYTKQTQTNRYQKQIYGSQGNMLWGGLNQKPGMNIHTLLQKRQITNKDLLYSPGNPTQYSVIPYMRKESKKEWVYVYE